MKTKNTLVLLFNESSVTVALSSMRRGRHQIKRSGTWPLSDPGLAHAESLGQDLHGFLRKQHLWAKSAVVGVPAKWVVGKSITLPPTSNANSKSVLEMQAEQAFSLNFHDLVFDYSGQISSTDTNTVLLVAMQRQRLERIKTLLKSAGLQCSSVTPSAAAMAVLSGGSSRSSCGVFAQNSHCEYCLCKAGSIQEIKHVPMALNENSPDILSTEIQRLLMLSGVDRSPADPMQVILWSDDSEPKRSIERLTERLGPEIQVIDGRTALMASKRVYLDNSPAQYDMAMNLILAQEQVDLPMIDFLNSHIGVVKKTTHSRTIAWALFIGMVLMAGLGSLYWGYRQDSLAIAGYEQLLLDNETIISAAQAVKQKVSQASGWYAGRPTYLDCLLAVTEAFPERGDIWVKTLSLDENGRGAVTGDAINNISVLKVCDALEQSNRFKDVQRHINDIGGNSGGVTYTIRFQYLKVSD
jgi:hypothetical protein